MERNSFLRRLWHGGQWAYYWCAKSDGGKETLWFPASQPPAPPAQWQDGHIYMGVHTTARAGATHRRALRQASPDKPDAPPVTLIGCLFAEWDAKDFDGGKAAIMAHIEELWADGQGLPWPTALVDSGGGYHGYWLLEEPLALDDDATRAQAIRAQAAWVALWGGDNGAKDIARVLRLPGTFNHKYSPPRPVQIADGNESRLYAWARLVEWIPEAAEEAARPSGQTNQPATVQSDNKRAEAYGAAVLRRELEIVQSTLAGGRNGAVNRSAYRLGQLVGGGVMDGTGLVEALTQAGERSGLTEAEARKAARSGFEAGRNSPRTLPAAHTNGNGAGWNEEPPSEPPPWLDDAPADPAPMDVQALAAPQRRRTWTAGELLTAEFPEPRWAVPGLLPVGLASLGARPKIGKSWMALQIAIAVGSGGMAFGQSVEQRRVLYLALEDSERRMQDRMRKQGATRNTLIDFHFETAPLAEGGATDIYAAIKREEYGLVVIDTFGRALGRADQNDLAAMTVASGMLQRMALDCNMLILLIDHHKKAASGGVGDVIDDIMGSTGKSGAVDVALGLYRQRGQRDATLKVTGRDVEERELAVHFDRDTGCWQMLGAAGDVRAQGVQGEIVAALTELGGKGNAAGIARFLGKQPGNVTRELAELVSKGVVLRAGREGTAVTYALSREP